MSTKYYAGSIKFKYCSKCGSVLIKATAHNHHKNEYQSYCVSCRKLYDDLIRNTLHFFDNEEYKDLKELYTDFIFTNKKNKNPLTIEDACKLYSQECELKCSFYSWNNKWYLPIDKEYIDKFSESDNEYFIIKTMPPIKGDYTILGYFIYSRKEIEYYKVDDKNPLKKEAAFLDAEIKFDDSLIKTSSKWEHRKYNK